MSDSRRFLSARVAAAAARPGAQFIGKRVGMCWIEIPSHAIREEVLARLDADPAATVVCPSRQSARRAWLLVIGAFAAGVAIGWIL